MQDPNDQKNNQQDRDDTTRHRLPDGDEKMVFAPLTADYLLERGYCCGNGCKHCPYHYKAVAEPKRSYLLAIKNSNHPKQ